MRGVEIVSTEVVREISDGRLIASIGGLVLVFIMVFVMCAYLYKLGSNDVTARRFSIAVPILILFVCIFCGYSAYCSYKTIHYKYEVVADDTTCLNEFLNTYEILSRDGNHYIVKEKF